MLIVATSPAAISINGEPDPSLVAVLKSARAQGNPVGIVSNHAKPGWFGQSFGGSGVTFVTAKARQNGEIISHNADRFSLQPHNVLVLAAIPEDIQMGKNGGAVLVAAGWSEDQRVKALGIKVSSAIELEEVIRLTSGWPGGWYFSGNRPNYSVRALADLSTFGGKSMTQQVFAKNLTHTVKNGGGKLNALLVVTARSLLQDKLGTDESKLAWGVYPSSKSHNDDTEILSDFTHRLRTTVSRVRWAKRGDPLFIRHTASPTRHQIASANRTDPSGQIETVHLNPVYENKLQGRHVIVVDDCTTYGVSFAVAEALLRKAGAKEVISVAIGKFGNQLRHYTINITTNPFKKITSNQYSISLNGTFSGKTTTAAQDALQALITS